MLLDKINNFFMPKLAKIANLPYILAIKEGMISTIPLTIVGSFFLILAFPPVPTEWFETIGIFKWIATNRFNILIPFRASMGLISIFVVYNTAYHLANALPKNKSLHSLDGVTAGTLALVAFFLTQEYTLGTSEDRNLGLVLPLINLGSTGLFVGIITAFISTEIYYFFKKHGLIIKMPPEVPTGVIRSFEALLPMATIMILFGSLHFLPPILGLDISYINLHTIIGNMFSWLSSGVDSLFGALLMVFFVCLLWIAGVHGLSVIGAVARPIWLQLLDSNAASYASNQMPAHIFVEPFYQWYVWIGGAGATIGLIISALVFAKSPFIRSLSKASIIPSLFNINEPIIFGMPLVMNPILGIPFILAPMVMTIVTWSAITLNIVPPNVILAPWTFPAPIGAYISSGGSIAAAVLVLINITISTLIYIPFIIMYDKQVQKEMVEQEK